MRENEKKDIEAIQPTTGAVDESSFNDSELEDIMSEIESLESEFSDGDVDEALEEVSAETNLSLSPEIEIKNELSDLGETLTEVPVAVENTIEDDLSDALGIAGTTRPSDSLKIEADEVAKTNLQKSIDDEVEGLLEVHKSTVTVEPKESEEILNVIPLREVKNTNYSETKNMSKSNEKTSGESQVNMTVSGQLNLDLSFEVSGEKVHLYIVENDGLVIELASGAKFTVPLKGAQTFKKVG